MLLPNINVAVFDTYVAFKLIDLILSLQECNISSYANEIIYFIIFKNSSIKPIDRMTFFIKATNLVISALSISNLYKMMNHAYNKLYGDYCMLHHPFYLNNKDSLIQGQENLVNYCISKLSSMKNKKVLDIGCGNGIQGIYILKIFNPLEYIGIDINKYNIRIANSMKEKNNIQNISFNVDDAHGLKTIDNESVDIVLNIESAFHYPDKMKFLNEIYRVLKPGGEFLIADVLIPKQRKNSLIPFRQKWIKYNNWTPEQYLNSLLSVNLETNFCKDISNSIKKGIQTYRNWYKDIKINGMFYHLIARIFIFLNAKYYYHKFKHSHKYYVFAGVKSQPEKLLQ